jgi:hypothetical protein
MQQSAKTKKGKKNTKYARNTQYAKQQYATRNTRHATFNFNLN